MRISAQRVTDQNDVVARRRQRAVGLVRDANALQLTSTVERQRAGKVEKLRLDGADGTRGRLRRWGGHLAIISLELGGLCHAAGGVTNDTVGCMIQHFRQTGSTRLFASSQEAHDG